MLSGTRQNEKDFTKLLIVSNYSHAVITVASLKYQPFTSSIRIQVENYKSKIGRILIFKDNYLSRLSKEVLIRKWG